MDHILRYPRGLWCVASLLVLANSAAAEPLRGTKPLDRDADFASEMVEGIDRFLLRNIAESEKARESLWRRDFSSAEAYTRSVAPNRARLAKAIGAVDAR